MGAFAHIRNDWVERERPSNQGKRWFRLAWSGVGAINAGLVITAAEVWTLGISGGTNICAKMCCLLMEYGIFFHENSL